MVVLEHAVKMGDRLDAHGFHYVAKPRRWHVIAEANSDVLFPEDLIWEVSEEDFTTSASTEDSGRERLGAQIVIPKLTED